MPNQPHGVDFLTARVYKKLDKLVKNMYVRIKLRTYLRKLGRFKRRKERRERVTHPL